jgi:hypothetical protein
MSVLSAEYSRSAFETSADVAGLCRRLAHELTSRMRTASSAPAEVGTLVSQLRALGHPLFSWDSDGGEYEIWGGDYVNSESVRMVLEFYYGEEDEPSVDVSFGPWPAREPFPACQQCGQEMKPSALSLRGVGHGRADGPSIRMNLQLGESEPITASCGPRSVGVQVPALWCATCNALWIRDTRAIGWTG